MDAGEEVASSKSLEGKVPEEPSSKESFLAFNQVDADARILVATPVWSIPAQAVSIRTDDQGGAQVSSR